MAIGPFCTGRRESLYEPCHRSAKRQIELHGYRTDIGLDGYPTDPNHPVHVRANAWTHNEEAISYRHVRSGTITGSGATDFGRS